MNTSLQELLQRVSEMRDDELLAIVRSDPAHYRPEAILYANAEITRRGLTCVGPTNASKSPMPLACTTAFLNRLAQAIRDGGFHLGFVITLLVFSWLDYRSGFVETFLYDGFKYRGFPFNNYISGGLGGTSEILWPGFLADVAIALLASVCVGWVFMRVLRLAIPNTSRERLP